METFGKRSQMILANLSEVRGQLERGCELQKSDGGFRMIDWMVSLGTLYRNCLANVRKVEQNGESPSFSHIPSSRLIFFFFLLLNRKSVKVDIKKKIPSGAFSASFLFFFFHFIKTFFFFSMLCIKRIEKEVGNNKNRNGIHVTYKPIKW